MKKILVLMLALALTLSLAACGGNKSGAGGADNTKKSPRGYSAGDQRVRRKTKVSPADFLLSLWRICWK